MPTFAGKRAANWRCRPRPVGDGAEMTAPWSGHSFCARGTGAVTKIPRGALQFSSTVGVTVLPNFVAENGFTIVVLLVWSQAPPALSPGPLLEGPLLDPQ